MRVGLIDSALLVVLSMTVVAGLVTVGVLMAVTLIVAPAVSARMLGRSLNAMFAVAVASGLMAGVAGLLVSYHAGLPTGPTVALLAVAQVGAAALWARPARALRRSLIPDRASAAAHRRKERNLLLKRIALGMAGFAVAGTGGARGVSDWTPLRRWVRAPLL